MFSQASVILLTGGTCVVLFGGVCVVLFGGTCVVLFGGACVVLFGGACVVLFGGCAWFYSGGWHAWFFQFFRIQWDTVNERAVRILLECILVEHWYYGIYLLIVTLLAFCKIKRLLFSHPDPNLHNPLYKHPVWVRPHPTTHAGTALTADRGSQPPGL